MARSEKNPRAPHASVYSIESGIRNEENAATAFARYADLPSHNPIEPKKKSGVNGGDILPCYGKTLT